MSHAWTDAFLAMPWLATLLWLALHGADWALTIRGARVRKALLDATATQPHADYELNPLFRADVAKLRTFSPRFVASWIGIGVLFGAVFALFDAQRATLGDAYVVELAGIILGAFVFTRIVIIGRHLQNIFLFGRILRGKATTDRKPCAPMPLDRRTQLLASAGALATEAVVLGVAAAATSDPWLIGGALGVLVLAGKHALLSPLAKRGVEAAAPAAPAGSGPRQAA